jgi:hypothetical protein
MLSQRRRNPSIRTSSRTKAMAHSKEHAIVPGVPKLPARCAPFVAPLFLSIVMTCIVSLVSSLSESGPSSKFASRWLAAWGTSWMIAFPALLVLTPVARRLTTLLVKYP